MEGKKTAKAAKAVSAEALKKAYIQHRLEHNSEPASVFKFTKDLGVGESEFYKHFNSFTSLERDIWLSWMDETIKVISSDQAYNGYSIREKLLAFYFTWLEVLQKERSYVLTKLQALQKFPPQPEFLLLLKKRFDDFIDGLVLEGKESGEIADRPFINQYRHAFWLHFMVILKFWTGDESKAFEKTDAAIEKSVNLAFDFIGKGPIESMVDFGKFLFQNKMAFV